MTTVDDQLAPLYDRGMADSATQPNHIPTHHGEPISKGDLIADFRGDTWIFDSIARMPDEENGTSGKVVVTDPNAQLKSLSTRVFNFQVFPDFKVITG